MATISRRTAVKVAKAYSNVLKTAVYGRLGELRAYVYDKDAVYDWLFERDLDMDFIKEARARHGQRDFEQFIMHLQTGESIQWATNPHAIDPNAWKQNKGREWLLKLAGLMLEHLAELGSLPTVDSEDPGIAEARWEITRSLELDGYAYINGQIVESESDILEAKEERGLVRSLFSALGLKNYTVLDQDIENSEKHYLGGMWDDSVSNTRQVLELVLREVARNLASKPGSPSISEKELGKPVDVRIYLEKNGLFNKDEMETIRTAYGFMSGVGSHPAIGGQDQARLCRRLGLALSEFVLIRYREELKGMF